MDIILYLLNYINCQRKIIGQLLNFICRYIPLKQWAFDDSHSLKYQKFKVDKLPKIISCQQDWTWKDLIPYYQKRYGKLSNMFFAVWLVIFHLIAHVLCAKLLLTTLHGTMEKLKLRYFAKCVRPNFPQAIITAFHKLISSSALTAHTL